MSFPSPTIDWIPIASRAGQKLSAGSHATALSGSASVWHMRFGYREYRANSI